MLKKITLFILSFVIIFNCASAGFSAFGADDTMDVLTSIVKRFPDGKYWNHMGSEKNAPDKVTDTPCATHKNCSWQEDGCYCNSYDKAIQCMGYAFKIAYEITGVSGRDFTKSKTLDIKKLRVGDIIRYRNDNHSICVTGVSGSKISFTDCNWDKECGIRWSVMDISSIKNFTYVLHLDSNNRKNTNLKFYEGVKPEETPETVIQSKETWQMSDEDSLNIRKTASTSAEVVGAVPAGAKFTVYEKKITDDYLWGKVKYDGKVGWAALNYSTHISGKYEKPDITNAKESYDSLDINLKWNAVSGAPKYQIRLYDEEKSIIDRCYTNATECEITLPQDGTYYVKIRALNDLCESWLIDGDVISFTAKKQTGPIKVTDIELSHTSKSLLKDKKLKLTAKALPTDAEDKALTWKSSDKAVATVDKNGTVTAVSYGTANITCTSSDSGVTAKCKITVVPSKVTNLTQNTDKTTSDAIVLKWSKVSSAEGYQILRYNSSKKTCDSLGYTKSTSFTDKTVKAGKDYYYYVKAYVTVNSNKIKSSSVKIKCSSSPAKVKNISQSAESSGTVTLKWSTVKNADLYTVYKYNSKSKSYSKVGSTKKKYLKISQKAASSCYYRIYAYTKTDWGYVRSGRSDAFKATAGPGKITAELTSAGTGRIKISWSKTSGATHYQIYRSTGNGYEKISTVGAKYGSFTNIKLTKGKTYYYRVRPIIDKNGRIYYGDYSSTVKLKAK